MPDYIEPDDTADIEDEGPQEGDWTTGDHKNFWQDGRLVLIMEDDISTDQMWEAIYAHMEANKYWPNVWFISDHGNPHLMLPSE